MIGGINEVQFVPNIGALNKLSIPLAQVSGVAGEVEDDRDIAGQQTADVNRQGRPDSAGAPDEVLKALDFPWIQRL